MKRNSGVDNTNRRTWDKAQYALKAAEKESKVKRIDGDSAEAKRRRRWEIDPLHQGLITQRANLKPRERSLDLSSRVGKTQVITASTPIHQHGAYYCSVCDCVLHDSISYLDHINGKWHNRALGMSMRVDRSTVEQVRARLQQHKKTGTKRKERSEPDEQLQLEYKTVSEDEQDEKSKPAEKTKSSAAEESPSENIGLDSEAAALMGFAGFGSSKN